MSETKRLIEIRELTEALHQEKLKLQEVVERILQKNQNANRLLLFVDQFEELYTLCPKSKIRQHFLDELLSIHSHLPISPSPHLPICLVILTLRADFMEQALAYRPFADALQGNTLNLGPMTREELQKAIQRPAEKLNITFETGLVERILDDIEDEPGNLPLLEFALTLLWERQTNGSLTHKAYESIGQVKGALARHADEVYAGLSQNEQQQLRRVLVQLVRPGEGIEDTRRLASRKELNENQWTLVRRIADARLVVTDRDPTGEETVEVVHESLIRSWGKLRQWMQADRSFRTWQERLRAALHQWETSGRDDGALLRGVPLTEAKKRLAERKTDLSQGEQEFIQASISLERRGTRNRLVTIGTVLITVIVLLAILWKPVIRPNITSYQTDLHLNEAKRQYEMALRAADPLPYYKAALEESDAVIQIDRKNHEAYSIKGLIYRNLQDFERAIENFEIVRILRGGDIGWILINDLTYGDIFHFQAANAIRSGDWEQAKNYQETAIQLFNNVINTFDREQTKNAPFFDSVMSSKLEEMSQDSEAGISSMQDIYLKTQGRWAAGKHQMAVIVGKMENKERQYQELQEATIRLRTVITSFPGATTLRYYLAEGYRKQALTIRLTDPEESQRLQEQALTQLRACAVLGLPQDLRNPAAQVFRVLSKGSEPEIEQKILGTIPDY
jgi:tetratricopeptide (TPR) repeat protein